MTAPEPTSSGTITNQTLLDAFSLVAQDREENRFAWIERAGLWDLFFARRQPYEGPPVAQLPGLTDEEKKAIQRKLIQLLARQGSQTGQSLDHLNLRQGPGTQFDVLQTLPPQTELTVLEMQGDWLKVRALDAVGYVHRDFVALADQPVRNRLLMAQPDLLDVPLAPPDSQQLVVDQPVGDVARLVANTWNRYGLLLAVLANELDIDYGVAVAVLVTESGGQAFGPDGRMIIRFENHVFYNQWGREHPETFFRHFTFNREENWKDHRWRRTADQSWQPFHGNQAAEWEVFQFAAGLDEPAAQKSISMGAPQIMGFNHLSIGYDRVQAMFAAFSTSEAKQIFGLFDFVRSKAGISALRQEDFHAFAEIYNGPGQAAQYAGLIEERLQIFHRLRTGEPALPGRGLLLAEVPTPAPTRSAPAAATATAADPSLLQLTLQALLATQRAQLWLYWTLLGIGLLSFLAAVGLAWATQRVDLGLTFGGLGIVALAIYAAIRPSAAENRRTLDEIEDLIERLEQRAGEVRE